MINFLRRTASYRMLQPDVSIARQSNPVEIHCKVYLYNITNKSFLRYKFG